MVNVKQDDKILHFMPFFVGKLDRLELEIFPFTDYRMCVNRFNLCQLKWQKKRFY